MAHLGANPANSNSQIADGAARSFKQQCHTTTAADIHLPAACFKERTAWLQEEAPQVLLAGGAGLCAWGGNVRKRAGRTWW
jgi:hypothetical protein